MCVCLTKKVVEIVRVERKLKAAELTASVSGRNERECRRRRNALTLRTLVFDSLFVFSTIVSVTQHRHFSAACLLACFGSFTSMVSLA